jgi:hypothetical protein
MNETKMNGIILFFYKDSCPSCYSFKQILKNKELNEFIKSHFKWVDVDVTKNTSFNSKLKGVPTIFILEEKEWIEVPLEEMRSSKRFLERLRSDVARRSQNSVNNNNREEEHYRIGLNNQRGIFKAVDNSNFQHGLIPGVVINTPNNDGVICIDDDNEYEDSKYNLNRFDDMIELNNQKYYEHLQKIHHIKLKQQELQEQQHQIRLEQLAKEEKEKQDALEIQIAKTKQSQFLPIFTPPQPNTGTNFLINVTAWDAKSKSTLYGKGKRLGSKLQNGIGSNEGLARTDQRYYTAFLPRKLENRYNPYGHGCP